MLAHSPYQRRGMTLVELMVVVLILGLLAVTVLPNLANSADSRKIREAARAVSSFVAASQSQAISGRSGGGIRIDVLPSPMGSNVAALDVGMVMIPQPYCGDDPGSVVTVDPDPSDSSMAVLTFKEGLMLTTPGISDSPLTDAKNKLLRYLRIRFGGSRIEFMFEPILPPPGSVTGTVYWAYMQDGTGPSNLSDLNQTIDNTSWPQGKVCYEITAGPLRNGNASLTLGDGVAIDMTNSYVGTGPIFVPNTDPLNGDNAVHVLFDSTGVPTSWISDGLKKPFSETLFLLINSVEAIQNNTSLTEPGGYWVAIDPRGGVPKVAEVNPQGAPIDTLKIRDSQEYIRKGLLQTGR
jgi:prepilin-type N-terminal cleavage/methylation domain-containing protein